jgi:hypothetical protein
MQSMRHYMNLGILPGNHFTVVPNPFALIHCCAISLN